LSWRLPVNFCKSLKIRICQSLRRTCSKLTTECTYNRAPEKMPNSCSIQNSDLTVHSAECKVLTSEIQWSSI
jgi:hypothetical protein